MPAAVNRSETARRLQVIFTMHFSFSRKIQARGSEPMSITTSIQSHISYELIDDDHPDVVIVNFVSREIAGPSQSRELGEELNSLIRPELPHRFVLNFANVRAFGSTAFGQIVAFARHVSRLSVCNMRSNLRVAAAISGLELYASFASSLAGAIDDVRKGAVLDEDDTIDFPELPPKAARAAAEATLDDFGGRSDAPGG
jgi:hypothetical protein